MHHVKKISEQRTWLHLFFSELQLYNHSVSTTKSKQKRVGILSNVKTTVIYTQTLAKMYKDYKFVISEILRRFRRCLMSNLY